MPDLVIWPEGKYPFPDILPSDDPEDEKVRKKFARFHQELRRMLPPGKTKLPAMIVGALSAQSNPLKVYNSALLLNSKGQVLRRYYKQHLVVFGEYTPFTGWFPFLKEMTPIGAGFQKGESSVGFPVGDVVAAPNICFESAVCHVVHESVQHLRSLGEDPDFLLNVTDDGWFFGQAVLDHHLACNVIRAVENRRPMIVAANTGLSAFVDVSGKIVRQGPRQKSEIIREQFALQKMSCPFATLGDWPAIVCTIVLVIAIVIPAKKPCEA